MTTYSLVIKFEEKKKVLGFGVNIKEHLDGQCSF